MSTEQANKRVTRLKLSERKWGCEIECLVPVSRAETAGRLQNAGIECYSEIYNHNTTGHWKIVSDASVLSEWGSGFIPMEIVSPPLKGNKGLRQLKKVLDVVNDLGGKVNNTCGLHVHHEVTDLNVDAIRNMTKYYILFEDEIGSFVSARRRGNNSYCSNIKGHLFQTLSEAWSRIDDWRDESDVVCAWYDRQTTLNLQPVYSRGTVEFRQHDATLDYADMSYWIAFTQSIIEASKRLRVSRRIKPDKTTMFRLARVQPIVRWHLMEQEERYRHDIPEPFVCGEAECGDDEDDDLEDDYVTFEATWDDENLGRDVYEVEHGPNGLFIVGCNCPVCTHARGD